MTKKLGIAAVLSSVLFCNLCMGLKVTENIGETGYCGSGDKVEKSETINYSRKETTEEYNIAGNLPNYSTLHDYTNCANIAGSVVIGYYDRLCENLISDYTVYYQIGTGIAYKSMSFEIQDVVAELYTLMETDQAQAGTTFNGYHKGMKAYVENHGYSYQTQDLGKLDLEKYKAAVKANLPVALFLSNYSMLKKSTVSGTVETIVSEYSPVAHVATGCGYRVDTYYNASNQVIATRTYLKVASGFVTYGISYLCLDGKTTISHASAITIT